MALLRIYRSADESDAAGSETKPMIPKEQWDLPAGYKDDGKTLATLSELANKHISTMFLADVPQLQQEKLVLARLRQKPDFTMHMIGEGVIDKTRAIQEVENGTQVGEYLKEIESNVIENLSQVIRDNNISAPES